jgi:DeoR family glycerol-3-phosphate regulon repressor
VQLVQREGFVSIEALAERFRVTPQTIRRDVATLSSQAAVRRFRGGIAAPSSIENVAYDARQVLRLAEKQRIARLAAQHVPNHASLLINIGTTTEEVARALTEHEGLRVITNNINVANILCASTEFEVIIAGGVVRRRDRAVVGEATIDFINQFKVDVGIIGISGIDDDGTLLDFDYREVRVARTIIENSRRVFLVADHTKFGRNALVRLGPITEVDALFTDAAPPPPIAELMAEAGVAIHIAA